MQFIKICTFSMGGWFETLKNLIKKKDQKRVHHNKQGIVLLCLTWQVKHIIMIHVSQLKKVMIKLVAFWCKFYMGSVKLSLFTFHTFTGVFFWSFTKLSIHFGPKFECTKTTAKIPYFCMCIRSYIQIESILVLSNLLKLMEHLIITF